MALIKSGTHIDFGIIKRVTPISSEIMTYIVFLEHRHQDHEFAVGIPVFSFGYNSYTYEVGSRVICLIKDSNFSKVFIIGQTYDPTVTRGGSAPKSGETLLSSGGDDISGISPLGKNDMFHAYTKNSYFKFDSKKLNISISNELVISGNQSFFTLSTDNMGSGFTVKSGTFNLLAFNGLNVFANDGGIYMKSQRLSFYEGSRKKPSLLISKGLHRHIGSESIHIFGVYSFEAASSKIKGNKYAVDWNVIQGSYGIRLGTGDLSVNLLNLSGAEVSFKVGVGPLYLSQFIFNQSSLEVKIGSALPDSLKLGGGSIAVKVGNIPGLQSQFDISGTSGTLKITGAAGSSSYEYTSSLITIKNTGVSGSASLDIGSGKLTLKSASKATGGKIILDGEVEITGNVTVKGSEGITVSSGDVKAGPSSISLTKHKHASSIPGAPGPPLPG